MISSAGALLGPTPPGSPYLEAYRALRTVVLTEQRREPFKSLLITSPRYSDGKTTVGLNLATVFALAGHDTVFVDADLRRRGLGSGLQVEEGPGPFLADYLSGAAASWRASESGVPRLRLISSGGPTDMAPELLGSARMSGLLEELREATEFIIMDSPPLAAYVDGLVLSGVVDRVILVVVAGSRGDLERRAVQALQDADARLLGLVVNGITTGHAAGQYEYYSYGTYTRQ